MGSRDWPHPPSLGGVGISGARWTGTASYGYSRRRKYKNYDISANLHSCWKGEKRGKGIEMIHTICRVIFTGVRKTFDRSSRYLTGSGRCDIEGRVLNEFKSLNETDLFTSQNSFNFGKLYTNPDRTVSIGKDVNCNSPHWSQELYETKAAGLILYGRALGLSHAEAEDVLQDTFMALMQQRQRPERVEHYCVRSFRNRALNYRRSLWRRIARELESGRWFEPAEEESSEERAAMHCLEELPLEQREVIVLKIWHSRTFEEIGELLEISPNTAAGRYRYGLQKMKNRLETQEYERERDEFAGKPIALLEAAPAIADA